LLNTVTSAFLTRIWPFPRLGGYAAPLGAAGALQEAGAITAPAGESPASTSESRFRRMLFPAVAALAFVIRLTPFLIGGGLGSYGRYDDGVYYAAADALTFGRVPYRAFVLLHPPGILLVLAPFAVLGRLTSDPVGMAAARLAFMAIGALNTVLVTALGRRWGRPAAVVAGVLYACWLPAVYSEQSTMLEPLGGTALLIALLLLLKTSRPPAARAEVLAGAALGLACVLKIWCVAPLAAVVVWQLAARKPGAAARIAASGAAAALAVLLPFALLARAQMFDMIVRDQLRRAPVTSSRAGRLASILGVRTFLPGHHAGVVMATALALALLAAAVVICAADRHARILVWLLAVNLSVLIASPPYFRHYAAFTAAPIALVAAVALGRLLAVLRSRPFDRNAVLAVTLAVCLVSGAWIAAVPQGRHFPGAQFGRAAPAGCVTADDPQALIQMNRLSRDLGAGCPIAIDVRGIAFDSLYRAGRDGLEVPRASNVAFQHYLSRYLLSGSSFVMVSISSDASPPAFARLRGRQPALAQSRGLVLRRGTGTP